MNQPTPQDPAWQPPADTDLKPLRDGIDQIDHQILTLLNERAKLAQHIGHLKAQNDAPVMRPEREAQVVARLQSLNQGPIGNPEIAQVFREIMSACRALEHKLQVAYLGPVGTYSEQAVWSHFGKSIQSIPVDSIDEVFRTVEVGAAQFGVVPVENSTEGSVTRTLDLLLQTRLHISGEISLPIHHSLLTHAVDKSLIREVCAHPQALAQCKHWLQVNLPGVPTRAVSSNAEGARLAVADRGLAAIAGSAARDYYELPALYEHIQDDSNNRTRFLVIGTLQPGASGKDLTSVVLSVPNKPGAVYSMLEPLARHGVSMTRFESRPARNGRWEYVFYMDVQGYCTDTPVKAALDELRANAVFFKQLGSYPSVSVESQLA